MSDLDLRAWQARFRDYIEAVRGWSPRTREHYVSELKPFFAYLERQGLTSVARLSLTHLEGYRLELFQLRVKGKPLSRSTQGTRMAGVKSFARFLYRENYLLLDIAEGFTMAWAQPGLPRTVLSEREVLQLLEQPNTKTAQGVRERTILELFYGTALRNSELCDLELDQLDLERSVVRIDHGKGDKARVVPLGEEALAWLEEYLGWARPQLVKEASQTLVFPGIHTPRMRRQTLALMVRRLAAQAGLDKTVTPHVLRHSCATHMLRRGANVRHLQSLLGHTSLNTTERYTRVELSDLARVLERFHPREAVSEE